jgi:hypothetical protein
MPHTSTRLEQITGKVLDERTHAPIEGAKIFLTEHPHVSCTSGSNGSFLIRGRENWHLVYLIGAGNSANWPEGQKWEPAITISHRNYLSSQRKSSDLKLVIKGGPGVDDMWTSWDAGDVLLTPKQ